VIIFDEIDAICKQRTGSSQPGSHDSIVNQLLSKIDGVDSLNNILLIGMTNRKELLDDALLRPGRLEVHMEIPLPNKDGRLQILNIHMGKARDQGLLADDVDFGYLADLTKNYTGAEIEGVCKNAAQYALVERNMEALDGKTPSIKKDAEILVKMNDYERAIHQTKPAFGANQEDLSRFLDGEMVDFGARYQQFRRQNRAFIDQVKQSETTSLLSVLLKGPPGSGKTALAAQLAAESGYNFIKVIHPDDLVGQHESVKVSKITKVFDDASRSPLSIIILDSIERLIEFVPLGPRFSNSLLQTLQVLIKRRPRAGCKLLLYATTSSSELLQDMDLLNNFNVEVDVPWLDSGEILRVLGEKGVQSSHLATIQPMLTTTIGIKQLLLIAEMAKLLGHGEVTAESFRQAATDCGYAVGL